MNKIIRWIKKKDKHKYKVSEKILPKPKFKTK